MNPSEYLYPLDLTGTQPSNRIKNEKHTVNPPNDVTHASFIVARACPFYEHTLVIKDGTSSTARTLVEGQDYICTHQSITLTHHTKLPVFASISFIDRQYTGTVYLSYNTVGGEWTLDDNSIVEKLTRDTYSIHHVSFDQIVGVPSSYPNAPHDHNPTSLVGLDEVVTRLTEIAAALRAGQGSYAQMATALQHHLTTPNAHGPGDVGLGNVKNFELAITSDVINKAPNKYVTANILNEWVLNQVQVLKDYVVAKYPTSQDIALKHPDKAQVYTKAETNNLYYTKSFVDATFVKTQDSLTATDVGQIVTNIVDTSQFLTRTETANTYYSREQSDTRYFTKSQITQSYLTTTAADSRYLQILDEAAILSNRSDNILSILPGNKLYAGRSARPEYLDLYIDCINGSDNHEGTKDKPLRTLARAQALTTDNRSSNWHLKHYSLDQMEKANSWYDWTFHMYVKEGAIRKLNVYGNTWIDGAKKQQASQLSTGSINPLGVKELSRLPIYCRTYVSSTSEHLWSVILSGGGEFHAEAIRFIKPIPVEQGSLSTSSFNGSAFFYGHGRLRLYACELMQEGTFGAPLTQSYSWLSQYSYQHMEVIFDSCNYGYTVQQWVNELMTYVDDLTSIFGYATASNRPFQYSNSAGLIKASGAVGAGAGAIAAGATQFTSNMMTVLQRPKMFSGLKIVNGVCVNMQTNLALVD